MSTRLDCCACRQRSTRKQAPTSWNDECERAEEVTHPLSIHRVAMVTELTMADMGQMPAQDTELADAYTPCPEKNEPIVF